MEIYLGAVSGINLENDLCILWHLCLIMFFLVILNGPDSLLALVIKPLQFFCRQIRHFLPHNYACLWNNVCFLLMFRW